MNTRNLQCPWHNVDPARVTPSSFVAIVEIPKGGKNKYELDKETGLLRLDRVLYTSTHYPANYGMIPLTYADDHDPLDVLILCQEPLVPMCMVTCRPIGLMTMVDEMCIRDREQVMQDRVLSELHSGKAAELYSHRFQETTLSN